MFEPDLSLTLSDAQVVLTAGLRAIDGGETGFDLARVEALDSAAVVILLAWQRAAKSRGSKLDFHNLPPALCSLAALYGVDGLLHLATETAPQEPPARH